ncbi:hypothetical protein AN958_00068 [Leucoagaricus sp. SymC.cos]|nr:hypothetical protein AN958_00068 [Leucoagaricus sp. SymC.cos]
MAYDSIAGTQSKLREMHEMRGCTVDWKIVISSGGENTSSLNGGQMSRGASAEKGEAACSRSFQ